VGRKSAFWPSSSANSAASGASKPRAATFSAERDGEVVGFAAWDANNRGLGWFGPTGVVQSMRGRGLGRELLLATLSDMAERYDQAVIPWTDALDFYAKSCGAKPAHRFVAFVREQP
jgi:predicted N-acetyltransferase YhbS